MMEKCEAFGEKQHLECRSIINLAEKHEIKYDKSPNFYHLAAFYALLIALFNQNKQERKTKRWEERRIKRGEEMGDERQREDSLAYSERERGNTPKTPNPTM